MDLLEVPRDQDYFSEKGIGELIGFRSDDWPLVVIKELIDNALDSVDEAGGERTVRVTTSSSGLSVNDSGPGLTQETLKLVYDFTKYTSSKFFRTVSRGQLGHGLKVVIGICFLKGWNLFFVTKDRIKLSYAPDKALVELGLGDRCFRESREPTPLDPGVYIEGKLDFVSLFRIDSLIDHYKILNPHVKFIHNGTVTEPLAQPKKMEKLHSIHWYTLNEFSQLASIYQNKYPRKTTRSFASIFLKNVKLDIGYPRLLSLFFSEDQDSSDLKIYLESLFSELKRKSPVIPPEALKGFAIGEKVARRMPELVRYTSVSGIDRSLGMNLPYLLEVLLLRHEEENSVVYAINRSPSIWYWPFRLSKEFTCEIRSGRKRQEINFKSSVGEFLRETGFLKGEGYKMFIHLVCPRLSFFDKSKNAILFDDFMDPLVQAMEPHLRIIKRQERAKSRTSSLSSFSAPVATGKLSKKGLMFHYFMEGYRMASGDGQYVTTARQVFYAVRKFIINNEGITLTNSDFDTFTQKVLTVMFEREPDLMRQIYFEQRGTFIDYDTKEEFPICTRTVTEYLDRMTKRANCICTLEPGEYRESSLSFDYPPRARSIKRSFRGETGLSGSSSKFWHSG
ncbi:MAG: ATP-binding protein [Candidatus Bathyarchaeia archaeon]